MITQKYNIALIEAANLLYIEAYKESKGAKLEITCPGNDEVPPGDLEYSILDLTSKGDN